MPPTMHMFRTIWPGHRTFPLPGLCPVCGCASRPVIQDAPSERLKEQLGATQFSNRAGEMLMKKLASVLCPVMSLALYATAQTVVTFSDMSSVNLPDGYPARSYLSRDNCYCLSPILWSGSGPHFSTQPNLRQAFIAGPPCRQAVNCTASIKIPVASNSTASFLPTSASLSAGWAAISVVVIGYSQSNFLGKCSWALTTTAQEFNFPTDCTNLMQLRFLLSPTQGQPGSKVMYT